MKLIIVRHGETEENKIGIIQGHLPGTLSVIGIEQAQKIALRLKDEKMLEKQRVLESLFEIINGPNDSRIVPGVNTILNILFQIDRLLVICMDF